MVVFFGFLPGCVFCRREAVGEGAGLLGGSLPRGLWLGLAAVSEVFQAGCKLGQEEFFGAAIIWLEAQQGICHVM